MKLKTLINILLCISFSIFLISLCFVFAPTVNASEASQAVGINLDNADIKKYIKYISELTGKKFIIDKQVKGSVTIYMPKKITIDEAYELFNSVLLINGFTAVDHGTVIKIIPTEKAKTENLPVVFDDQSHLRNNYVTRVIKLIHVDSEEMNQIILPLIPSESSVVAHKRTKSLVVTDTQANITKIVRIVKSLDTPLPKSEEKIIGVVKLDYMKASDIETVIKDTIQNEEIGVKADQESNSILIASTQGEFENIKKVIKQLDQPRKMVYLESLILEVDTSENFSIGTKWLGLGNKRSTKNIAGWSGSSGTTVADGQKIASLGNGFSLGTLISGIDIGGMVFPNITAVINTYKSNDKIKIISNPQILTKNNKLASISVGQNIPYLTRTDQSNSGNGYSNYEYKDVATKLSILPQINTDKRLSLEIGFEVSKINTSSSQQDKPTTFKRTIKTTVVVNDQETIVLGGIIGNDQSQSEWKIPLLGDIPYLGWLFKETTTSSQTTNMFVFITPHIISNSQTLQDISQDKRRLAEGKNIHKTWIQLPYSEGGFYEEDLKV